MTVAFAWGALYASTVHASDGLVAWWQFEEGFGTTARDSSPTALHGAVMNAGWTDGVSGGALEFDGVDDYVELNGTGRLLDLLGSLDQGTISLWFRLDSTPAPGDLHALFYLGDDMPSSMHSGLIIEVGHSSGSRRIYFTFYENGSVPLCFDSVFDLELNRWYHFAVVVDRDFNTGYLDGQEMTARRYNYGRPTMGRFFGDILNKRVCWLGQGIDGCCRTFYFHGAIDEVRIYDRPLTGTEIREYCSWVLRGGPFSFQRGDCNDDGKVDLSDATCMLNWLFLGQDAPGCAAASNTNGDGGIDVSDATFLLNHLFLGGRSPDPPFLECGVARLPADMVIGCSTPPAGC